MNEAPRIRGTIKDSTHAITFHVMAYVTLSRGEMLRCVSDCYRSDPKLARRNRKSRPIVITIPTLLGL